MKPGTVLGDIAFITQVSHDETAIAEQRSVVYQLSMERFSALLQEHPDTANVFQRFMMNQLAEQLAQVSDEVKTLWN